MNNWGSKLGSKFYYLFTDLSVYKYFFFKLILSWIYLIINALLALVVDFADLTPLKLLS